MVLFLIMMICISVVLLIFHYAHSSQALAPGIVLGSVIVLSIALSIMTNWPFFEQVLMDAINCLLLLLCGGIVILLVLVTVPQSAGEGVWVVLFFIFLFYTLLPVRMRVAVLSGCLISLMHVVLTAAVNKEDDFLYKQVRFGVRMGTYAL